MRFKTILTSTVLATALVGTTAQAEITLRHAIMGTPLDLSVAKKGGYAISANLSH
ncbi:hypothetical protein [methane-oxidizing endosymbiont of Gigantopelta aegis]|uniref:hypothetical protein n=1 Tax=methane-oxidizing endosymbiont of Gigantopelta aegis TaxID=2794938 RepID=UPI0018DC9A45|nr:hypothetical protein [methane-oxidizing endosymbiont of Gigantopelta aegis]